MTREHATILHAYDLSGMKPTTAGRKLLAILRSEGFIFPPHSLLKTRRQWESNSFSLLHKEKNYELLRTACVPMLPEYTTTTKLTYELYQRGNANDYLVCELKTIQQRTSSRKKPIESVYTGQLRLYGNNPTFQDIYNKLIEDLGANDSVRSVLK